MADREELKEMARRAYGDYMAGNPYSAEADSSPLEGLSLSEIEIYNEVSRELRDERLAAENRN